jgi:hypothetical protein
VERLGMVPGQPRQSLASGGVPARSGTVPEWDQEVEATKEIAQEESVVKVCEATKEIAREELAVEVCEATKEISREESAMVVCEVS